MLKKWGLFIGPVLFLILSLLSGDIISPQADAVLAVALWMIIWWVSEAVHIAVTALLPLLLFPLLNVAEMQEVSQHYGNPIIFLFFGGFVSPSQSVALIVVEEPKTLGFTRAASAKQPVRRPRRASWRRWSFLQRNVGGIT